MRRAGGDFDRLFAELSNWGRWGRDDGRGTLNLLTEECRQAAARLVRDGCTVQLGSALDAASASPLGRPVRHEMTRSDRRALDEPAFFEDFFGVECHGLAHTHVDALNHCAYRGRYYNGQTRAPDVVALSAGVVGRGVLLDIPALDSRPWLDPGRAISDADLDAAERMAGLRVGRGDILLIRTGFHVRLSATGGAGRGRERAGLHTSALGWLSERQVAAIGSDGDSEAVPHDVREVSAPIHCLGLVAMGLCMIDCLDLEALARTCARLRRWEFLFAMAPLAIVGGTGSPVNPIAVL